MATFTELCSDVYTITNRPDLIAETKLAVKAATLKAHQSDFYYKDLFETGVQWTDSAYVQQLDLKSIIPLFRSLKYVRRYDNSGTGASKEYFKILTPNELLDSYGIERTGVAYMAGSTLNIKSYYSLQYALVGVYKNPDITEASYTSWVATDHPFAIVFEAARLVYKQIGFDEQSAAMEKLVQEQFVELKTANIVAEGY